MAALFILRAQEDLRAYIEQNRTGEAPVPPTYITWAA